MWRRRLEWCGFGAGAFAFGLLGLCGAVVLAVGDPGVERFGNGFNNVGEASIGGDTYRFAVLGDTQKGITGYRRMMNRLREEKVGFYLHTGDLVSDNDLGHYRLARWVVAKTGLDAPLFVVPGNHDVKGSTHLFEKHVGPLEVEFARGKVVFLTVDDSSGEPPPLGPLERRLRAAGQMPVVLAMHVPPFDTKSDAFRPSPGFDDFVRLVRKYRVRYVLSGHSHAYRRVEHEGTLYVANGVGGDSEKRQFDQKVYATVIEVAGIQLKDRAIELEPSHGLWDNVEHLAIGHVAQAYRRQPIWCWGGTAMLLACWIWVTVLLWRKKK